MALDIMIYACSIALGWLSRHPAMQRIVGLTVLNGVQQYGRMTPAQKAEVHEIVKKGVKLVVRLGISDAMEWTRNEVQMEFPDAPPVIADAAAQAVAEGGQALIEAMESDKRKR